MTNNTPDNVWTDARVERLKELWPTYSASAIAADLGDGITRGAIIGKAHRLHLSKKSRSPTQSVPRRPRRERTITIRKNGVGFVPIDPIEDEPLEADVSSLAALEAQPVPTNFLGITFKQLNDQHCRYIRTVNNQTLYCGQPKIEDSSYCIECHRRCHSREARRAA